ncbi:type VII secretion target [Glycomyces buryatensis]|uniref:ESX-1 secretion-associated protein n=1 Tax=Glycomyces buryatensis TaxID=2570927 RepID=A0A4S8QFK8_9ACTN|nr:type VII secretion target [Glycomyces buryatensis]THV41922.1 hypothetical protein FAB82_09400 [Glycomyces buryatensis]
MTTKSFKAGKKVSVEPEGVRKVATATRGDVADPLQDVAQAAVSSTLSSENAFSEYLANLIPPSLKGFDETAEKALLAASDFAEALAKALEDTSDSYESSDKAAADDLTALTGEL